MISNETITPLLDLVFYPLLVLALVPFMRLFFLIITGLRTPPSEPSVPPELVAWKRDAEAGMARASIVPLRRKRRAMSDGIGTDHQHDRDREGETLSGKPA